jgi:deoxyribodipyrimidine photo-lyase
MNVFWFRRDLRLDDNVGLFHALKKDKKVLPIFIFDDFILSQLPKDDARVTFIHQQLENIQSQLQKKGKSLAVFYGKPSEIFKKLIVKNTIETVFTNHDYEPYARKRDLELYHLFKENNIEFKTSKDQIIFEKSEVVKDDGTPYVVYTPYANKWKEQFKKIQLYHYNSEDYLDTIALHSYPFLNLTDFGFTTSTIKISPFDSSNSLIDNYEATRNFPALNKTSYLGIYLIWCCFYS